MVRRFHRSIYDELDELRASMDYLYQLALEPADNPLLPEGKTPDVVCQSVHNLNAEFAEHDDEVTVTLDTVAGTGNSKISVDLINETTLRITCNREEDRTGDDNGNRLHERQSFSLNHVIPLPCRVIPAGAKMSLRNGVLDIRLKKSTAMINKKTLILSFFFIFASNTQLYHQKNQISMRNKEKEIIWDISVQIRSGVISAPT